MPEAPRSTFIQLLDHWLLTRDSAAHARSLFAMADSNGTRAVRVAEAALGPVPAHLLIRTPALTHVHVAHRPCMKYSDTCTARTHVWTARLEPGLEGPSAPWRA